jgi:hypothetical protein
MPVNWYTNATEAELVACLESIQRRQTTGEVMFVTLPGGGQMQRTHQNTKLVDVYAMRILYSLYVINPSDYDNPYTQRIKRTLPSYV